MIKNKEILLPLIVFVITFIIVIVIFEITNNKKEKYSYSCYDYENNVTYTFDTEAEMHEVCDKLNSGDKDQIMESYSIYNDLIETDDPSFVFYPYINSDNNLSIVIGIVDCNNPTSAKEKAKKWFSDHSYNINDYVIEYEDPCEIVFEQ